MYVKSTIFGECWLEFGQFKNKFDFLIDEWLEGKKFKSPDVPKLEKINSKLDKSQQLNFIENLKKNF